jgi:hypothetical protein
MRGDLHRKIAKKKERKKMRPKCKKMGFSFILMPVILYLETGSAYIKLKGLFMLSTNKIQGIFHYLPQFKIYFSRTFRPCIITFRFVFNYT